MTASSRQSPDLTSSFDPQLALERAQSASQGDRDKLLMSIAELCRDHEECARPEMQSVLKDVLMALLGQAETKIRQRLAKTLADVAWAPSDLINVLAGQQIDIARPILARSRALSNHDLVRLLVECSIEHKIEIARRPTLSDEVAAVIIDQAEPDVLTAMANNVAAQLNGVSMERLVRLSEQVVGLRAPMTRRPELTASLAALLYGWVGEALRQALSVRFPDEALGLRDAMRDSLSVLTSQPEATSRLAPVAAERAGMEQRVVEKLQAAGQLRPGLVVRALNEGKLPLFITVLGALAGLSTDDVRAAVNADHAEPLIVICTLAGIDKGAFPTVINLVQKLNEGRPGPISVAVRDTEKDALTAPLSAAQA